LFFCLECCIILGGKLTTMSEEDIKNLENIALEKLKNGFTKEEALQSLIRAGILDKNGNYTEPYKILEKAIRK
jgi:hypothetical protein